jgi:hypothetical protein
MTTPKTRRRSIYTSAFLHDLVARPEPRLLAAYVELLYWQVYLIREWLREIT